MLDKISSPSSPAKTMRYLVKHITRYSYEDVAASCHNQVHLSPRNTALQACSDYRLWIHPTPACRGYRDDYFGNRVDYFSIEEPHTGLTITSSFQVRITAQGSAQSEVTPAWEQVLGQLQSSAAEHDLQARELCFDSLYAYQNADLLEYARASFEPKSPIVTAVRDLTRRIHHDFRYEPRSTTISTPLREVFERRVGVCQDFAHLQIACLRSLGLAARYVSGYLRTFPAPGTSRLVGSDASHAWLSVYCGPAGWIDFDPTNNTIPGTEHTTVAWGRDYADVCPIQGVFVGGGAHAMSVSVDVQPIE